MKHIVLFLIRSYKKWISPMLPMSCRFYPTCSEFMHEAIVECGLWRGILLGLIRLLKCHPFHPGGYDPVPRIKR
jgi:putative membrane protein insertion efficiency factor